MEMDKGPSEGESAHQPTPPPTMGMAVHNQRQIGVGWDWNMGYSQ
jgi:hypothetical protein